MQLQTSQDKGDAAAQEHAATVSYLASVHGECDWLLANFDVIKQARASEVDAMGRAKAVLSGAKLDLQQTSSRYLRGSL